MSISTTQANAAAWAKAKRIQARRVSAGKRGFAKAVRRICRRIGGDYRSNLSGLPVNWDIALATAAKPSRSRPAA